MKKLTRLAAIILAAVTMCLTAAGARAEADYPTKPVRVIVGFPSGTVADVIARLLGAKLSQSLGQQFLVDNRPGASSNIGAELVVRAPKDGYTLFMSTVANTINASVYQHLNFNFSTDLAPIMLVGSVPNILVVNPSLPVHSVADLIALAKTKPGEIFFASSGNGTATHLSGELFNVMAGVKLSHIPYKGSSEILNDLIAGRVTVMFSPASTVLPYIKAGTLRALASTGAKRTAAAPDLPTIAESGLPGFETSVWMGLLAPAGTPSDVIEKLDKALTAALASPDIKAQFATQGVDEIGLGPKEFGTYIRAETDKWAKAVKAAGVKID